MNSEENLPKNEQESGGIRKVPPAPDAIVPRNMDQVRALLTGRDPRFREPIGREEQRRYNKVWRRRGKGFTKPLFASSKTRKRKQRQKKLNKWAKQRQQAE